MALDLFLDSLCPIRDLIMRLSHFLRRISSRSTLPVNTHVQRSHTCGELRLRHEDSTVCLFGWVTFNRLNRFLVLRDAYGSVQAIVKEEDEKTQELLSQIPYESVVRVEGKVKGRGENRNPKMETGDIEVEVSSLQMINKARNTVPLLNRNESNEKTRLKYRYLDLRTSQMQSNMRMRSDVVHSARRFLVEKKGFVDVETPTLFRRTPGGAAEFIVPTRTPHKGLAYSLPQSPQQFKQLLMVGGIDRYFQIARCYRDEGAKLDRQPEFTQLDIEVSFPTQQSLMSLLEEVLISAWPSQLNEHRPSLPFPQMSFRDAMRDYGVDKPDLRIPWKIEKVSSTLFDPLRGEREEKDWSVSVIRAPKTGESATKAQAKEWKGMIERSPFYTSFVVLSRETRKKGGGRTFKFIQDEQIWNEFGLNTEEDTLIVSWGKEDKVQWTMGQLRSLMGERVGLRKKEEFKPLWVVDFPLFERDEEGRLASCHHPFTAPIDDEIEKLRKGEDLEDITAQHFDLVLNGVELGGGSIRIHESSLQRKVLQIVGADESQMTHLLEALESGAPPHGGFAFGLDRLVALLAGRGDTSYGIRNVIAFPKSTEGRDIMTDTPVEPSKEELERYGYALVKEEN